jgi:hypothetical protein
MQDDEVERNRCQVKGDFRRSMEMKPGEVAKAK